MAAQQTGQTVPAPKKVEQAVSHKGSITGFILSLVSLMFSGLAYFLMNMKYTPTGPTTGSIEAEAGHAVATGTTTILGTLLGVPFLVGAIALAIVAVIFVLVRLRKVKVGGAIFSAVAIAISVWSFMIAIGLFDTIKADPQ